MARRAVWLGPLVVLGAALLRGPVVGVGAAIGVALAVANFLLAGWVLSWAGQRSPYLWAAAGWGSFPVRLILLTLALAAAWMGGVSLLGLTIGLGAGYVFLLGLQVWAEVRR